MSRSRLQRLHTLTLPDEDAQWSLKTQRERAPGRATPSLDRVQLAEGAVPRALFAVILRRIDRLRGPPVPAM